ncbi:MAG: ABC transporter permease subunit [Acidimicrobiia bacterium]|nr:ABC transporter permease subunit [Acidimicrobiia bacterium]
MTERIRRWVPAAAVFVAALVLWEGVVRVFDIQGFLLPAPSAIVAALATETDVLTTAAIGTFATALVGLGVGSLMAALAAFAASRWPLVREGAMPVAIAANSTPIVVLAPVANSWFGLRSMAGGVFVVAVLVFFPVMINLVRGLMSANASELELMQSYAAPRRTTLWKLQLPNALPYLFSALKVAAALSLIGAIVKEYFGGSQERLGQYITSKAALFQYEEAWAAIVVASAFGILLYLLILLIERRAMPWHVSVRRT